jgi:hypothetical protein
VNEYFGDFQVFGGIFELGDGFPTEIERERETE